MRCLALVLSVAGCAAPHVSRVVPLGGQAGSVVEVELVGKELAEFSGARFDTGDLEWVETLSHTAEVVRGKVRIGKGAALGPHRLQARTRAGLTNTRLFNVTQFPGVMEVEPNDRKAQEIPLRPQVIHGYMKGLADGDRYTFLAKAGERWVFDLQSMERGGFLECSLRLLDEAGREVAFNDDQDEYLETPRLVTRFARDGRYVLQVDQYRGPQGVNCGQNCGYALQVSQLPVVSGIFPLGARPGQAYGVRVHGEALGGVTGAYLQRARGAEHYRLTFPYSMPVDGTDVDLTRVQGRVVRAAENFADAEFLLPSTARPGLWRLWLVTAEGTAEAMAVEVDGDAGVVDGMVGPESKYAVELAVGRPFHAWTVATQLGLPFIDTVLELWSADGKLLAEHDDLMTGQGTVIGNPDSSLYYLPKRTETAKLVVRDRNDRSGPSYAFRLHMANEAPGFQLITEPEEFVVTAGGTAVLEALLIKQPGFEKAVDVWVEGMPATKGTFRADQHFGPSGDGDNINIPSVELTVRPAEDMAPGDYVIRVRARASDGTGPVVEGLATLWIGPNGKRNDTRRPLPGVAVHVVAR